MILIITPEQMQFIQSIGESAYPEEGAGLLLGRAHEEYRGVSEIYELSNARTGLSRLNRYLISPEDLMRGENYAEQRVLVVIGIFHSHPDHPYQPS